MAYEYTELYTPVGRKAGENLAALSSIYPRTAGNSSWRYE
jgi:hypothetical protein